MSKVEQTSDQLEYNLRYLNFNKFNGIGHLQNYNKMSNLRIIQKKLVYVIGLSTEFIKREVFS